MTTLKPNCQVEWKEWNEYMTMLSNSKSKNSILTYTDSLNRFRNYFNLNSIENVKELSPVNIRSFQDSLKRKLSPVSVNSHMRNIKVFYHWLIEEGYLENDDTFRRVKSVKQPKREKLFLSEDEVIKMVEATGSDVQNKLMLVLMFQMGLRRNEVTEIRLSDISNCTLLIRGKGDKQIRFPIPDEVCELMQGWMKIRRPEAEYLFHAKNSSMNGKLDGHAVNERVQKFAELAGIDHERAAKVTAHSTRRFFGSSMYEKYDLTTAQKMLRHESDMTTRLYVKVTDERVADAIKNQTRLTKKEN